MYFICVIVWPFEADAIMRRAVLVFLKGGWLENSGNPVESFSRTTQV